MTLSGVTAPAPPRSPDEGSLAQDRATDERPIGMIVNDAWQKADTLIRQELQLALADAQERVDKLKVELEDRVAGLKAELTVKAVGAAFALVAIMTLAAALVLGLTLAMPPGFAALLVGLAFGSASFLILKRKVAAAVPSDLHELLPQRAAQNMKQDMTTIKEAIK
jgi:hypothetical protein